MFMTRGVLFATTLILSAIFGNADDLPSNRVGEIEQSIGFYQAIGLTSNSLLYETKSLYQSIEVHQTEHFGKLLLLDGVIQLTERDADSYNEMMAHVPMFQHRNPKRVLVIGGGDGYVLKEVLKHPSVVHVDHVDLDEDVIKTCRIHFPQWGDCWEDPRAMLHIEDGAQFVRAIPDGYYDVIVQDSSDPWVIEADGSATPLPSGVLYDEDHLCQLQRILAPDGILNLQVKDS
jgi:spermidine synthase